MTENPPEDQSLDRYVRQMRYPPLGEAGQRRLATSRVLVCGCGALGSVLADTLVRAGVGHVRIADRDFVETNNLQRQVLFDEQDVADQLPKAIAAAAKLAKINSQVVVEPLVVDVDHENIVELVEGVDMIVDGTDNFQTRFLLNDIAVREKIPWVYGGCLGTDGQTMTILPGETACLRCLMQECPPPGTTPTCDTAGIVAPIINVIASIEALEAIKVLSGNRDAVSRALTVIEMWDCRFRQVDISHLREQVQCPTCRGGDYPWLAGKEGDHTAVLCGRNAVQVTRRDATFSLDSLAERLRGMGEVSQNAFLLRAKIDEYELTVFHDGRAIIGGTDVISTARTVYAKYIGS